MNRRPDIPTQRGQRLAQVAVAGLLTVAACSSDITKGGTNMNSTGSGAGPSTGTGGTSGQAGSGTGATMSSGGVGTMGKGGTAGKGSGGNTGMAGSAPTGCSGTETPVPKRLIRLSFNQIANAITSLFDGATTKAATATVNIPSPLGRTFPPLGSGTEGNIVTDTQWSMGDTIAQGVATYVFGNFATATKCGASPTSDCGRTFVSALADRAFRRTVTDGERSRLLAVYDAAITDGGSVQDAVRYGIYAVFESPLFLYRTEFGTDANVEGPLTASELANELAFFLTDAPPDPDLLAAVASNGLATPDQVGAQATRLLATDGVRTNLETAMSSYFSLPSVAGVIIDPTTIPGFTLTDGARSSIYHESELFLQGVLWNGPLSGLLTSRQAYVNSVSAPLYGLDVTGRTTDQFDAVQLGEDRAGLLTLASFLMAKSRPDNASVVGRGLVVNKTLLCQTNPEFPKDNTTVANAITATAMLSQKEQADYRAKTAVCLGCHGNFDAFGLALERFDSIGRSRTMDLQARTIDDAWITATLPEIAGGGVVHGAGEMAAAVVASGAMQACVAKNFLEFGLADTSQGGAPIDSCAVAKVVERFNAGDQTFTTLIREIAASSTFSTRAAPAAGGN